MQITKRGNLPLKRERGEGIDAFLKDNEWPPELNWDGKRHVSCSCHPEGNWTFQSMGEYLAADWTNKVFLSYRCSRCGIMVQYNQTLPEDGSAPMPPQRLVIIP